LLSPGPAPFAKSLPIFKVGEVPTGNRICLDKFPQFAQKMRPVAELDWPQRHENTKKQEPTPLLTDEKQALEMDGWSYGCYGRWSHGISSQHNHDQSPQ
jgi:hypothetical protein